MAARPIWRGQIRLALVSIPVELYSATKSGASIAFHQVMFGADSNTRRIESPGTAPGVSDSAMRSSGKLGNRPQSMSRAYNVTSSGVLPLVAPPVAAAEPIKPAENAAVVSSPKRTDLTDCMFMWTASADELTVRWNPS